MLSFDFKSNQLCIRWLIFTKFSLAQDFFVTWTWTSLHQYNGNIYQERLTKKINSNQKKNINSNQKKNMNINQYSSFPNGFQEYFLLKPDWHKMKNEVDDSYE